MRFFVNDACIGCGLCAGTCPEVFSMKDNGTAEAADIDAADEDAAVEAMENCPVDAIKQR